MEKDMIEKKIPSALPIWAAAGVFLLASVILPVYRLWAIVLAAVLAAAAWAVCRRLIPPRTVLVPAPGPMYATGEKSLDDVLTQAAQNLDELRALDERIADEALSGEIRRMDKAGRAILAEVTGAPEKGRDIRKFAAYYLPTAVKVLGQYAELEKAGAEGANAQALAKRVKENAGVIAAAFEAQLDALFAGEALDVTSDLAVLRSMAGADGLSVPDEAAEDEPPKPTLSL